MIRFSVHLRGSTLMILARIVAVVTVWAVFAGVAHAADPAQADCLSADPDRSLAGCTAVLTRSDEAAQDRAVAFYNRGNAYRYRGDTERAIADYSEAIRLKPDYALAFYNRGDAYADRSKYDHAIVDFSEAIRLKPDDASAFNSRGIAYAIKGESDRAIADFSEAIRLKPDYASAFSNRGRTYERKGDNERAKVDYTAAARLRAR